MTPEYRYVQSAFELRGLPGEGAMLIGYAASFNVETTVGERFREQVAPSAFKKTAKESDIRALFNHDPNIVLGRNRAGTLRLMNDDHGLRYEVDLPSTQQARDLWTSIDRGDISQSSFSFLPVGEDKRWWEYPKDELPLRTLREVRLFDISPVTYPQYETTEVQARSLVDAFAAQAFEIPSEDRSTQEPETAPNIEPAPPLEVHAATTPEPEYHGTPILVARLALIERLK